MDLTNLENALNSSDFKEQVYRSLEGIYQISNILNQLDLLKNFSERDYLEIVKKIQAIKNALEGYEKNEQELKAKIYALVDSLEIKKQELARLNMELQSVGSSETQKLNDAGNALKTQLISELRAGLQSVGSSETQKLNDAGNALKTQLISELRAGLQSVGSSETQKLNDAGNALKTQLISELRAGLQSVGSSETQKLNDAGNALKTQLISELRAGLQSVGSSETQKLNDAGNALKTQLISELRAGLQSVGSSETQKLNDAGNALKTQLISELRAGLQSVGSSETQKLNDAGNALKTQLISELRAGLQSVGSSETQKLNDAGNALKTQLPQALKEQMQGVIKFLAIYVYGRQVLFINRSNEFMELFEFSSVNLQANKSYIVQFSMPYELSVDSLYSDSMGEVVLCLKANSKAWPIINSFYQNKTSNINNSKIAGYYSTTSVFTTPSEQADYKIAVFSRKHKDLWVNVNYTPNMQGFETSFLNDAHFRGLTTQSISTTYNNDWVFYKHSQAIVYEIVK